MSLRFPQSFPVRTTPPRLELVDESHVRVEGRRLLYFAGSDYLRLSGHPAVREAMAAAARRKRPLQLGASRRTTGEHAAYLTLERALARFFRVEDAVLVTAGYLAPLAAAHALKEGATQIFLADPAHACVQDAARLTDLPVTRFALADVAHLQTLVRRLSRTERALILTDGAFAIRGGLAPLDSYARTLEGRGLLFVDDAHGAGAVGPGGRGSAALLGVRGPRLVQSISLAKALGVAGGAVLGPRKIVERVRTGSPAFVGTTAPPVPVALAAACALSVLAREPERVARLQSNAALLHQLLAESLPGHPGVLGDPRTPVTGVVLERPAEVTRMRRELLRSGIFPPWIRYLAGPAGGFFRFSVSSEHTAEEVRRLAAAIAAGLGSRLAGRGFRPGRVNSRG